MSRKLKKCLVAAALVLAVPLMMGFSLLGPGGAEGNPAKLWQLPGSQGGWDIGYNQPGDIGAPVDPIEAYRLNIPEVTYAFDESFRKFFGTNGVKAVDDAFRILNELPPASRMSDDLTEFPLSAAHLNHEAAQLGLIDLKTMALMFIVEEMGLTDPIRWAYAIRRRFPLPGNFGSYIILQYNYDPVTLQPSSYVNGNLWTYEIFEDQANQISDAIEKRPPNLANEPINYPVAANTFVPALSGYFFTSLTRDDVGALRYLLRPRNMVTETLLAGTLPGAGSAWNPFIGTNFLGSNVVITNIVGATNNIATAGLRGGVDKIHFRKVQFDSLIGQGFTPITNQYLDRVVATNSQLVSQVVRRPILVPDIIFTVTDSVDAGFVGTRTDTANWINNDLINGIGLLGGPGVIAPPIVITFNYRLPFKRNVTPFFVEEPFLTDTNSRTFGLLGPIWASFDGSTNEPVIYPTYLNYSINDIRNAARGGAE